MSAHPVVDLVHRRGGSWPTPWCSRLDHHVAALVQASAARPELDGRCRVRVGGARWTTSGALAMMSRIARPSAHVRAMWLAWTLASILSVSPSASRTSAWIASGVRLRHRRPVDRGQHLVGFADAVRGPRRDPGTRVVGRLDRVAGLLALGVAFAGVIAGVIGVRATIVAPAIVVSVIGVAVLAGVRSITALDRAQSPATDSQ